MTRISIRGLIVGSAYDGAWAAPYIERGRFTPESHFRRALAEVPDDEDLDVYINSEGGDVVAGGEIRNAIVERAARASGATTLTVGTFAASMAANIVLTAGPGVRVRAHSNSILYYHGAWSLAIGGSEAMADEARILGQVNAPIKEALASHGVPADDIEEGFREGRSYTMTAQEAKHYGIVSEIIGEAASDPMPGKTDGEDEELVREGVSALPVAALAIPEPPAASVADDPAAAIRADYERRLSGLQAAKDRRIQELSDELAAAREDLGSARAETSRLQALAEESARDLASVREQLDAEKAAHARLVGGVLTRQPEAVPLTREEALREHSSLPMSRREAYYRAHRDLLATNTTKG